MGKSRRRRSAHAKAVQTRTTERLKAWHFNHKDDKDYREKRAAGSRRHLEQVYRDAELGRMTREVLAGMGELLTRLAALRVAAGGEREAGAPGGAGAWQDRGEGEVADGK